MRVFDSIKNKNIDELASVLLESAIIDDVFLKVYCPYDCEYYNKNMKCCMLLPDEVCGTYKVAKKDLKKYCVKRLLDTEQ